MKRRFTLALIFGLALIWVGAAAAMTAAEIAKKSLGLDKSNTKVSQYSMEVYNKKGRKRVFAFTAYEKEFPDGEKKLLRFSEPADSAGTGLMSWERKGADDLQWLFLPSRKQARQLAAADKGDQFMGSDLFMEDMGSRNADEYDHEMLQEQVMFNGHACYLLESKPKPALNSTYGFLRSWIDRENFVAVKMELYGKDGKLIKTVDNEKAEMIDGHWTIVRMVVTSANGGKAKTIVEIKKREYDVDVPDRYFTKQFLETY